MGAVVLLTFFIFILIVGLAYCCRLCTGGESEEIVQQPQNLCRSTGSRSTKCVQKS
jgi:hypothetical protein